MTVEILELAGNVARDQKKQRIMPRHIMIGIRTDSELAKLLNHVDIFDAGVIPQSTRVTLNK
jgi:histone H2A